MLRDDLGNVIRTVSIIINNYNYARYIGQAIESAIGQTYLPLEVIVVDDGSTDESGEIIEQYRDRVQPVFKPNGGQASAFNAGFQLCSGEIVFFLDSDDMLNPDAVARVVDHWTEPFSKVQFPLKVIDDDGLPTGELHPRFKLASGDLLASLLRIGSYNTSPTTGNAFARSFLEAVMPMPEKSWAAQADCYLISLAPFYGTVGAIYDPLGSYRVYSRSLSQSGIVVQGALHPAKLRKELLRDILQQDLIYDHCIKFGYHAKPTLLTDRYAHYKLRLASLKADPARHPFAEDRLLPVALQFVRRVWTEPSLSAIQRILLTVWSFALSVLPLRYCHELLAQAIASPHRKRTIERVARLAAQD